MRVTCALISIAFFAACQKPKKLVNEITKVELSRSGAWVDQGAAIGIDSSLNYYYYGLMSGHSLTEQRKYYAGKINERFWDSLNRKIEAINYKKLRAVDNIHVADVNIFELIVYWKNGKKRIVRANYGPVDSVLKVMLWINSSYKKEKLNLSKDSIKFGTTLQITPQIPLPNFPIKHPRL